MAVGIVHCVRRVPQLFTWYCGFVGVGPALTELPRFVVALYVSLTSYGVINNYINIQFAHSHTLTHEPAQVDRAVALNTNGPNMPELRSCPHILLVLNIRCVISRGV